MFELDEYEGRLCSGRTSFEFLPKKQQALDLGQICSKLNSLSIRVEVQTPAFLIFNFKDKDITIFKRGKILIKGMDQKEKARELAEELIGNLK